MCNKNIGMAFLAAAGLLFVGVANAQTWTASSVDNYAIPNNLIQHGPNPTTASVRSDMEIYRSSPTQYKYTYQKTGGQVLNQALSRSFRMMNNNQR